MKNRFVTEPEPVVIWICQTCGARHHYHAPSCRARDCNGLLAAEQIKPQLRREVEKRT